MKKLLASKDRRFITFIVDFILLRFIFAHSIAPVWPAISSQIPSAIHGIIYNFLWFTLFVLYYIVFESIWNKTTGKFLTKTRVVNLTGGRPSFKQIVIRSFARLIPLDVISFFWKNGRWHDRLSKTLVVNE